MTSNEPIKRFYKAVAVSPEGEGWSVKLDGRLPRSPRGQPLITPARALAELIAAEWEEQETFIRLNEMAATRMAHTVLDWLPAKRAEVRGECVRYLGSDLLCYLADGPQELIARQEAAWKPVREWFTRSLGVELITTSGIAPVNQPAETLDAFLKHLTTLDDWALAGVARSCALFGSAVLAWALTHGRLAGPEAFALSRLDEAFQEEQWGVDDEAAARAAVRRADANALDRWLGAVRGG
jgi:chaperone required for assembly of F1-ATPase